MLTEIELTPEEEKEEEKVYRFFTKGYERMPSTPMHNPPKAPPLAIARYFFLKKVLNYRGIKKYMKATIDNLQEAGVPEEEIENQITEYQEQLLKIFDSAIYTAYSTRKISARKLLWKKRRKKILDKHVPIIKKLMKKMDADV